MSGREAMDAFAQCLTHGVCPHQIIAQCLGWLDGMVADDPDVWSMVQAAFKPIPRFERLVVLTVIIERGIDPPAQLITGLFDLAELRDDLHLSAYRPFWPVFARWLTALPPAPEAELLWRTALIPAPPELLPPLIDLLGAHASPPAIGALTRLTDHPTYGASARAAISAIKDRFGAHLPGSLERVDHDDQRGQLSLTDPAKGQLTDAGASEL
jgi:hypothetical protein